MIPLLIGMLFFQELDSSAFLTENQRAVDSKDMRLVVTVDPTTETISGFNETHYQILTDTLRSLDIGLIDSMKVKAAQVDGQSRPFKHGGNKLSISLPEGPKRKIMVRIDFEGKPLEAKNPPWDGGFNWSKTDSGQPWVGVSCQGEGGQVWFPCKANQADKLEGVKLEITVPEPLYCATVGLLKKIEPAKEGWRTFHWETKYPITTYNVSINIADYQIIEGVYEGTRKMPVILYMLKEYQKDDMVSGPEPYEEKIQNLKDLAIKYLTVLAKYYGEFPFIDEKFGLVHTAYRGMEHQTINSYGGRFFQNNGVDGLMLHEMGHEWFGNKLTATDAAHLWLQEGICTYTTGVYLEEVSGLDAALRFFRSQWYRVANKKPLVQGEDLNHYEVYNADIYNKGALTIHALRWLLGKDTLDSILKEFVMAERFTYVNEADTKDLIQLAEKISGQKLDWFFDRYVYQAEAPLLTHEEKDGVLYLQWQDEGFNMPLELEVKGEESRFERVDFTKGKAQWKIPEGASYQIDSRQWVYKIVKKGN